MSLTDSPGPKSSVASTPRPVARMIAVALAWLMFFATAWLLVPRFETIYLDFGVGLPWYTVAAVKFSHLVIVFIWLVPAFVALIVGADWGMLRLLRSRSGGWSWLWSGLILLPPVAGLLGLFMAMVIALASFNGRLSG
ncbi:MAG: hypothetical protein ABI353_07545 [Isosphaeraceae bacterium]